MTSQNIKLKRNLSIQIKSAFLLLVFSLNIFTGFACAVGIDMGFNSSHHHEENEVMAHHGSHHDEMMNHQKSTGDKDGCCNGKVTKIAQADKSLPPTSNSIINPLFFIAFISSGYNIDVLNFSSTKSNINYFVRSSPPTIPDIRITIQSFQI